MKKYLICVDLDSTFLKEDKSISEYSKQYVKKLVEAGHYFIINTGRPHQGCVQFLKELDIHQPIIVNNGSAIVEYDSSYQNVTSYTTFDMNEQIVKEFNDEVEEYLVTNAITSLFNFYSISLDKCPFFIIHKSDSISFIEGRISSILNTSPIRTEYYVKDEYVEQFKKVLSKEKYKKEFDVTYWGEWDKIHSFEISSFKGNKGQAMEFLAKKLDVSIENTISFGDQLNDIPMIKTANDGVAISNAREEVKLIANHVTKKDNDHDGVVLYLESLNLI